MGYTHYAYLKLNGPQDRWSEAVMAAKQIVDASPVPLANGHGDAGTKPVVSDSHIYANGVGDDGHETLVVPTVLAKLESQDYIEGDEHFMFCKTARKPYDIVVTAVYATLAEIGGPDCINVHSDGDPEDFTDGAELASSILGREIPTPKLDYPEPA